MAQIATNDQRGSSRTTGVWKSASFVVVTIALILFFSAVALHGAIFGRAMLGLAGVAVCSVLILHARFLHLARSVYMQTNERLLRRDLEYRSIFDSAPDAILVVDASARCRAANPTALQLFGIPRREILGSSIARFCRPNEFDRCWARLLSEQSDREQLQLLRKDHPALFVELTASADFLPGRHMVFLRDVTERRRAEDAVGQSLAVAQSAWKEADALRKATLALTQNLRLDAVLDTLFETLAALIPYEEVQVLLLETDSRLFLVREASRLAKEQRSSGWPNTLRLSEHPILQAVLYSPEGIIIRDTLREPDSWRLGYATPARSWLGIRMLAAGEVLGLLSLGHSKPETLSEEHLRLARSLAIPAAAAIENARLYERAQIYGEELRDRLADLRRAEEALRRVEDGH
ncbi:PAS domain-containing protein [Acidisarcina polymorpha]|nr:PAS domain-containing protein [Acidisarcina polymorpha]